MASALMHDKAGVPYRVIGIGGKRYKNARLAVFYMTGKWPAGVVDHRDGDTLNDVWGNLRDCTRRQNSWNRRLNSDNKSGYKGVFWHTQAGCWGAAITANKKKYFLGLFDDIAAADLAYKTAAKRHHGEFVRA